MVSCLLLTSDSDGVRGSTFYRGVPQGEGACTGSPRWGSWRDYRLLLQPQQAQSYPVRQAPSAQVHQGAWRVPQRKVTLVPRVLLYGPSSQVLGCAPEASSSPTCLRGPDPRPAPPPGLGKGQVCLLQQAWGGIFAVRWGWRPVEEGGGAMGQGTQVRNSTRRVQSGWPLRDCSPHPTDGWAAQGGAVTCPGWPSTS